MISFLQTTSLQMVKPQASTALPPKKNIMYRALKHPWVNPYNRLAVLMAVINLLVYLNLGPTIALSTLSHLVLANFAIAILIRQQYVVNLLFAIATSLPTSLPLSLRWAAGKVYHFGGVHVGTFFSGSVWLCVYFAGLLKLGSSETPVTLVPMLVVHIAILLLMIAVSLPQYRAEYHNEFEIITRFGGWISLLLFWTESVLVADFNHTVFLGSVECSTLLILTFSTALPWMRLKKVPVQLVSPSSHAVLAKFNHGVTPFAGSSTELSRNPLLEWHSFANIPSPGEEGFRLTISRAGDWTGKFINDAPSHIWVKGIPTAGVGNIETLFKKVIWVATGSGIGPCIPHLLAGKVPSNLVWSTKNPRKTFGDELVGEIQQAQPEAIIWDTDSQGKPNLVELAYKAYKEFGAEAIICIANKKVTWEVVEEFESRGIPAFGAIWDS